MMNRRKFISLGSLGISALLFPSFLFSTNKSNYSKTDVNLLLKSAADLRKEKKYNQAKQVYQQIIAQFPNEIRAYDGMRKILLSQKKTWEVILMFKAALLLNPNNVELKQRLYKEYFSACLGNKKIKTLINFNGRLLSDIKQKYETFVQSHPNNKNIQKQYSKICRLLDCNADNQNPIQNINLKNYTKQQYQNFKTRFDTLSNAELEVKLNDLLAKPFSIDRKQHIRELYKISFQRLRKEKSNTEALAKALSYYNNVEKNDPLFLKYIRDLSRYEKKFDTLITVETQNHTLKNNFWSALALVDAHIKKNQHQNLSMTPTVNSLMTFMEPLQDAPNKKFELNTRKIKIAILNNQFDVAKDNILMQCKKMFRVSDTHSIDRMNVLIAQYYAKSGNSAGKNSVLNIAINPTSYIDNPDTLIQSLALINQNRDYTKTIHIQNLQKLINKL